MLLMTIMIVLISIELRTNVYSFASLEPSTERGEGLIPRVLPCPGIIFPGPTCLDPPRARRVTTVALA